MPVASQRAALTSSRNEASWFSPYFHIQILCKVGLRCNCCSVFTIYDNQSKLPSGNCDCTVWRNLVPAQIFYRDAPICAVAILSSAAILHALRITVPTANVTIASDSQTGLQNIHNLLTDPHRFRAQKHRDLLHKITNTLLRRTGTTPFLKVKAHCGIKGNEKADAAATKKRPRDLQMDTLEALGTTRAGHGPTRLRIPINAAPFLSPPPNDVPWQTTGDPKNSTKAIVKALAQHQRKARLTTQDSKSSLLQLQTQSLPSTPIPSIRSN